MYVWFLLTYFFGRTEAEEELRRTYGISPLETQEDEDTSKYREEAEGIPKAFVKDDKHRREAAQVTLSFSLLLASDPDSLILLLERLLSRFGNEKTSLHLAFRFMLSTKLKDAFEGTIHSLPR